MHMYIIATDLLLQNLNFVVLYASEEISNISTSK